LNPQAGEERKWLVLAQAKETQWIKATNAKDKARKEHEEEAQRMLEKEKTIEKEAIARAEYEKKV
jgi:hypothetical protein